MYFDANEIGIYYPRSVSHYRKAPCPTWLATFSFGFFPRIVVVVSDFSG